MYWSVRRELWENRSIYIAPLTVAAVILFGSLLGGLTASPTKLTHASNIAAVVLMGTMFLVAVFYCVDALHSERRDRSVLFFKSLPVSDLTTVLSKAAIPLVVLPLLTFLITIATQFCMLLLSSAVTLATGHAATPLWTLPWLQMSSMLLYHLVTVHSLYYAPIFGWLLFVSAWAKRVPLLWAVLPLFVVGAIERMVFHSSHLVAMLGARMSGGATTGGMSEGASMLGEFAPGQFLSMPGLWIGFVVAAAFLAIAVRMRHYRGPI